MRCSTLVFALSTLSMMGCGGTLGGVDAAGRDGSSLDAGPQRDAGADAGYLDAGTVDGGADAGPTDAGASDAGPADAGPPPGVLLYPSGARHSPVSAEVAAAVSAIATSGSLDDDALMKVGDSITVSRSFLHCLRGDVDLGGRPLGETQARFRGSYTRTSLAATVGWSSFSALEGSPNPVEQEHAATRARYATLMFGSNDAGFRDPQAFARDVWRIAELLIARGTVPLMSTIPPRDDSAAADARVPLYNLAVRAIAQGLRVPLVDFHAELLPLPSHGLSGDGVHPRASGGGCVFDTEALSAGYNVRNLITLEQLARATGAADGVALEPGDARLLGAGTASDPFVVPQLPFAAMGDSTGGDLGIDTYGCASANESGPSRIYRVEVPRAGTLRALALSDRDVDVDVHILTGLDAASCVSRDDTDASAVVTAGTHYVVVDTFSGASTRPGRFLVTVTLE
ncbi:MAG: SGNH/GDSL hydrolase family protein [Sandaracinaceae bacterium]